VCVFFFIYVKRFFEFFIFILGEIQAVEIVKVGHVR